jgi:phosphate:Na+ symporter
MMQLQDTALEEHSFTEQMDAAESAEFARLSEKFGQKYLTF